MSLLSIAWKYLDHPVVLGFMAFSSVLFSNELGACLAILVLVLQSLNGGWRE